MKMDKTRLLKFLAFVYFMLAHHVNLAHTQRHFLQRHKRQHGANLYLPETFIIPEGEGNDSEWGPWGTPSECSRTCGGGVAHQTRECLILDRSGQPNCEGGSKKYFSCNTQDCPDSQPDFRQEQCSYFDRTPFEDVYYHWVPYTKAPNPCELNCMPRGERFYYRHKAKVIDGTRCNDHSVDVCVDGQCQPVGCNLMLGSPAREDKCRKCQGDGSSCKTVNGLLDMNNLQVGYNDILLIPQGASNIVIQEKSPSNNYLAIRNLTGHYYLNGNYRIDFPRPMTFAGSLWTYERKPNGFAAPDKITCLGPTAEAIYLVLLSQDQNVGVNYEYSVPRTSANLEEPEVYSWTYTKFEVCSKSCGGGHQSRNVTCTKQRTLEEVDPSLCDSSQKPAEWQKCGSLDCAPQWVEGEWTKCSAPCGQNGTRTRQVHCEKISANGAVTEDDDNVCLELAGNKPATVAACNEEKVCPIWFTSKWQPCNKLCGDGKQTRQVICYRKEENGKITVLDEADCQDEKPAEEQDCQLQPCEGVEYIASSWSGCDVCGTTEETRSVYCASKSGKIYDEKFCADKEKPELSKPCNATPPCDFSWFSSQWTKCSALCGKGVQNRVVICGKLENDVVKKVEEDKCEAAEKPEKERECEGPEKCPVQWFAGPWSDCNKKCGGGIRTRKVICLGADGATEAKNCQEDKILFASEDCNMKACADDELLEVDTTSKPLEEDDEGEEYCDEDYDDSSDSPLEQDGVVKVTVSDSDLTSEIEFSSDATTDASTLADEEMLSDATGFETEITDSDSTTDITVDGSGSSDVMDIDTRFDGSGDESTSGKPDGTTEASASSVSEESASSVTEDESKGTETEDLVSIESTSASSSETSSEKSATTSAADETTEIAASSTGTATETTSDDSTTTESETTSDSSTTTDEPSTTQSTDKAESSTSVDSTTRDLADYEIHTSSFDYSTEVSTETSAESSSKQDTSSEATGTEEGTEATSTSGETETTGEPDTTEEPGTTESSGTTEESATESEVTGESEASTTEGATESTEESVTEESSSTGSDDTTLSSDFDSTTVDIWSTTDSDDSSSTAVSFESAVRMEQKPKKCKPRPKKPAACLVAKYGCCGDNQTAATGPFKEGCTIEETCKETKFNCCPDGATPAKGEHGKGCPKEDCKDTLFGCCPDEESAAEGNDNEGCPEPTTTIKTTTVMATKPTKATPKPKPGQTTTTKKPVLTGCFASKHGCCKDNKTEATGPKFEGCSTCIDTTFGCCKDNKTPAHGQLGEGCCLLSTYGCCPDNVNEARSESLEGCGCEYSPFGCCPDQKTSAKGHDNEGCGCRYSPHGCCPDGSTAATGASYEGCPCHAYQFGCCPDGVSIATGPHNQGCHCSNSKFKCCSDNVTPAKGPDFEGCTCATSQFGCCPDGSTEAKAANFEGCEDQIPDSPQKACSLKRDMGTCSDNYTVKYFFDTEYGGCSRFWYGGCGGNENRFNSEGDCKDTCVEPSGKDVCQLPKIHGPCTGYYPMWHYDTDRNTCTQFIYGGCLGNANRFEKIEDCQSQCVVDDKGPQCDQPIEQGVCSGSYERWGYDKERDACVPFNFGGCKGNKNNYPTESSCDYHCKNPGVGKTSCNMSKETGDCGEKHARWYFSQDDNKCMPFYYTGCGGNDNNYDSENSCSESCPSTVVKDTCLLPADIGNCQTYVAQWYFDTKIKRCRQFYYGGCGGNDNRFLTEADCDGRCSKKDEEPPRTEAPRTRAPPREEPHTRRPEPVEPRMSERQKDSCMLPYESGKCREQHRRYYYDRGYGICSQFLYTGCDGNENNFETLEECESLCDDAVGMCDLAPLYGRCSENITKWHYDSYTQECQEFDFSGCYGNKNNFDDKRSCENACRQDGRTPEAQPATTPRTHVVSRVEDICSEPEDSGSCDDYVIQYAYNSSSQDCRAFYYGGCGGNGNRFNNYEECESSCINRRPQAPQAPSAPTVEPSSERNCNDFIRHCNSLRCPYGLLKSYEDGCERCECEDPCSEYDCAIDSKCSVDVTDQGGETVFVPVCRKFKKPGQCPRLEQQSTSCDTECHDDADCRGHYKCCSAGCSTICHAPTDETIKATTKYPYHREIQAPVLEEVSEEDLQPVAKEGGVATLRCFATGFPPPSITWKRGGLELKTNQGRFVLTSNGELQIVQLHRTDAGTYVCVAYNGIGNSVEREIKLTVDEPVDGSAYILGDGNSTVISTIAHPVTLRCLAGGYPKPFVTWWRGDKILPLKDDRIEITRDYSLTLNRVDITDLGAYVCQAYNSIGRPVSIQVTLKARGPVYARTDEERRFLQYVDSESRPVTTTFQPPPVTVPAVTRPRPTPYYPPVRNATRPGLVPVTANIMLPKGNVYSVGSDISMYCNVSGEPTPEITWYKDNRPIDASNHVEIPEPSRIIIAEAQPFDSGNYRCVARNDYSQAFAAEVISVEGFHIPSDCSDNKNFANCALIVKGNYCNHKYYAKFCCRSCTLAGQLQSHVNQI